MSDNFRELRLLGRTGLTVGRLGVASSFGAPVAAYEEAFDQGCNYFYWGSLRRAGMGEAIRHLCGRGQRDRLVVVVQSYSRLPALLEESLGRALKRLRLDTADVLLLGWFSRRPPRRLLERAQRMREQGMFRFLGLSGHHRPLFPELARDNRFDLFHVRYNAAHRGAETEVFAPLGELPHEQRPGLVTFTATRWGQLLKEKKMPPGEKPPRASDLYRFSLSHPTVDVCLTGPANLEQMREALRSLDLGPLSAAELARLRAIGDFLHG
jgi:aryl-alcohol dehydrogenase-like predicted oxidoreductase